MSGFILLHRGWRDSDVFEDDAPLSEREAWLWLLEKAAWKACVRTTPKGERIRVERGQFHTSFRNLAAAWGWGKNRVDRFLQRLSDHEMIGTVAGQSGVTITICNYSEYQDERDSLDVERGTVGMRENSASRDSRGTVVGQPRDSRFGTASGQSSRRVNQHETALFDDARDSLGVNVGTVAGQPPSAENHDSAGHTRTIKTRNIPLANANGQKPEKSTSTTRGSANTRQPLSPEAELKKSVFDEGVSLLADHVPTEARRLIGKWRRDCRNDDERLLGIIRRAAEEQPWNPVAWVAGAIRTNPDRELDALLEQTAAMKREEEYLAAQRRGEA